MTFTEKPESDEMDILFDNEYRVLGLAKFIINADLRRRFVKVHSFVAESFSKTDHQIDGDSSSKKQLDIEWETIEFATLPQWLQWNEHLHRGHRPQLPSVRACVRSWFRLHTETVNIWSHSLACLAFSTILAYNLLISDHEWREKLAMAPYVIGFAVCFGLSSTYHTISCHSERISRAACTCDYLGILCSMMGAFYSAMFYMWWCRWHWLLAYYVVYSGLAFLCVKIILGHRQEERRREGKRSRALFAIAAGCSALVSLAHDMVDSGLWHVIEHYPMGRVLTVFSLCLFGAFLYSTRMPERLWPGKFDIWGHSHQIFHILVAAAAFVGYEALMVMVHFRATMSSPNSTVCSRDGEYWGFVSRRYELEIF